jgi:hypothetical protein
MSNVITDSRKAIMAKLLSDLTATNGLPFTVVAGTRDGVSRDRNIACVFAPPLKINGNVNFANPAMVVRAWVKQPKPPKATSPQDPEPVEQLQIDLLRVLGEIVLPAGLNIYWIVDEITTDYADWGVQATLRGWTPNPGLVAP